MNVIGFCRAVAWLVIVVWLVAFVTYAYINNEINMIERKCADAPHDARRMLAAKIAETRAKIALPPLLSILAIVSILLLIYSN